MVQPEKLPANLIPIPGYEGAYSMSPEGVIVNRRNRVLKSFPTSQGEAVELRYQGQRERILVKELLQRLENNDGTLRAD